MIHLLRRNIVGNECLTIITDIAFFRVLSVMGDAQEGHVLVLTGLTHFI